MGKIRHKRTKYHTSSGDKDGKQPAPLPEADFDYNDTGKLKPILKLPPLKENPFSNITISRSDLLQTLKQKNKEETENTRLESNSKTEIAKLLPNLNKKDRRKLRRDKFLEKLGTTKLSLEKKKKAKKRSKAPVIGDLLPMALALPTIEAIMNEGKEAGGEERRKKKKRKPKRLRGKADDQERYRSLDGKGVTKVQSKRTQKHMLYEIQRFQKLLSNADFKKNSLEMAAMIKLNAKKFESES